MAKTDNLNDFLKDIAKGIQLAENQSAPYTINPQDFRAHIETLRKVSGTKTITSAGTHDVSSYENAQVGTGSVTVSGGGLTAGNGSVTAAAVSATGLTLTATTTKPTTGPYITATGSGAVSRAAITKTQGAGYITATTNASVSAATSANSKTATVYYTLNTKNSDNVSISGAKTTVAAGYYPNGAEKTMSNGAYTVSGGGLSGGGSVTPTVSLASGSDTNMGNITVGSKDTTNYPYYFKVGATSTSGSKTITRAAVTATQSAGYISGTTTAITKINSGTTTVTINQGSGSAYVGLKEGKYTVAGGGLTSGAGTVSAAIKATGISFGTATTSAPSSGPYVTVSGSGKVSMAAVTATQTAGYLPATTTAKTLVSAVSDKSSNTATRYYPITGVNRGKTNIVASLSDENDIQVTASNAYPTGYVTEGTESDIAYVNVAIEGNKAKAYVGTVAVYATMSNGSYTLSGGGLTAGSGSASAAVTATGITLGTAVTTKPTTGPYLKVEGKGTVTRAKVTATQTAGYLSSATTAVDKLASATGTSNTATVYYPITGVSRANTTIGAVANSTNGTLTFTATNNQSQGYQAGGNKTATATVTLSVSGKTVTASVGTISVAKTVDSKYVDTTSGDATAAQILTGKKAWVDGAEVTGTMANQGSKTFVLGNQPGIELGKGWIGSNSSGAGYYSGVSVSVTADYPVVTPTTATQTIHPDLANGCNVIRWVTVNPIPSNYKDTSSGDAAATQILSGKKAWVDGAEVTGTMPQINLPQPIISVNNNTGVVSAYVDMEDQAPGYVAATAYANATRTLTTKAGGTIKPSATATQTWAKGTFLTSTLTVAKEANLVSSNIKSGVTICGVTGDFSGGGGTTLDTWPIRISTAAQTGGYVVQYTNSSGQSATASIASNGSVTINAAVNSSIVVKVASGNATISGYCQSDTSDCYCLNNISKTFAIWVGNATSRPTVNFYITTYQRTCTVKIDTTDDYGAVKVAYVNGSGTQTTITVDNNKTVNYTMLCGSDLTLTDIAGQSLYTNEGNGSIYWQHVGSTSNSETYRVPSYPGLTYSLTFSRD